MVAETPAMDFDLLVRRARVCGMYVNRHRDWNPLTDTGGDLYLMERRTARNPKPPTLLKFASAEEIGDALTIIERETFKRQA
jgi:hypothetical protein